MLSFVRFISIIYNKTIIEYDTAHRRAVASDEDGRTTQLLARVHPWIFGTPVKQFFTVTTGLKTFFECFLSKWQTTVGLH